MNSSASVTVITVVFNAENLIHRTLTSVSQQTWTNLQHLIIDGASSDNTLQVINAFSSSKLTVLSGKDKGIYDAMNKGLQHAVGEYVIFINAGDELAHESVISEMIESCINCDVYYGDTLIVDVDRKVLGKRRHKPPRRLTWKSFCLGMLVSHQSILARRSICPQYNLEYKISADIDWSIRLVKSATSVCYYNKPVSLFLAGGESTQRKRLGLLERWRISVRHYGIIITVLSHLAILARAAYYFFTGTFRKADK